jgi:murein DD-endopeptidase MepM/ murein hydrolase activator NlpD
VKVQPLLISILVILVVFTGVFTFLVLNESNQITEMREGGEGAKGEKVPSLQSKVNELKLKIHENETGIELRKRELRRADLELAKSRYLIVGDKVVAGIATHDQTEIDGKPLADSPWALTRTLIATSQKDTESLKAEHESPIRQKFEKLDQAVANRQDELQAVLKRINDQEGAFREDQDRLNQQIETLGVEKEKAEKANREDYSRRATRIGQLEDKIRDLLELELHWLKDLEPEGRILEVNPTSPHVIINLGASDRVQPGLLFEVFQYDRGRYVEKGMIEVVQTQAQIATCRVLNVKDARKLPLSQNDYIGNPVFSTRRPKVFVVSGEFKTHNKEDLEMFIRQTGGIVREKLSPGVDILVAGERSDKDQDNAREYAVHAMTEAQLLKYIRRDYAPK